MGVGGAAGAAASATVGDARARGVGVTRGVASGRLAGARVGASTGRVAVGVGCANRGAGVSTRLIAAVAAGDAFVSVRVRTGADRRRKTMKETDSAAKITAATLVPTIICFRAKVALAGVGVAASAGMPRAPIFVA
jgi:hypothetical protein